MFMSGRKQTTRSQNPRGAKRPNRKQWNALAGDYGQRTRDKRLIATILTPHGHGYGHGWEWAWAGAAIGILLLLHAYMCGIRRPA